MPTLEEATVEELARIQHENWLHSSATQEILRKLEKLREDTIAQYESLSVLPQRDNEAIINGVVRSKTIKDTINLCRTPPKLKHKAP
jgi:uncharacterized protein HemY